MLGRNFISYVASGSKGFSSAYRDISDGSRGCRSTGRKPCAFSSFFNDLGVNIISEIKILYIYMM